MKILVTGMNYIPEKTGIGPLTADMCKDLVMRGHQVTMITAFPHYPEWRIHDNYRGNLFAREALNGVRVRRGFVYVPGKPNPRQRIVYDSSIALSAGLNLLGSPQPDVIVVISPPLQLVVAALAAGRLWKAPVLLVLQDIVPDVALSLDMLRNPTIIRLARMLEQFCYRYANHISVIGQGFCDNLIAKGVPPEKLSLIPDWVDVDSVKPMERMSRFRRKHEIDADIFVVLYGGNMSFKQGLDNAILAAEQVQDQPDIRFFLIGQGAARDGLEKMVGERISNVTFLPFEPEEMFPDMLAAADVLLLNQRADVRDAVLPCKFLNYMAAGRPVAAAVHADSETATYMNKANCGIVVPPEQPSALAGAIRQLYEDDDLRMSLGASGRLFAEANFSRRSVLNRYAELIESLARNHVLQEKGGPIGSSSNRAEDRSGVD